MTQSEAVEFAVVLLEQPGHAKEFQMRVVSAADCFQVAAALRDKGCNVQHDCKEPRDLTVRCPSRKAA